MNRSRLLLIGLVALALGALTSFTVYRNLQSHAGPAMAPGVEVVVAANDLQVGAKIDTKDVKIVHLPPTDLPAGYQQRISQVVGRGVILPMSKGEFILPSKMAAANAGYGMSSLIPPGMRAVSVRVNDVVSLAGFVQPGTRVDVLVTGNPAGSNESQTTTVLENVAVLATGTKLERDAAGQPSTSPVITLLVSPDDAQRLTLASNQGRIQLAMRNPLDTKQEDLPASRAGAIYKGTPTPAPVAQRTRPRAPVMQAAPTPSSYSVEVIKGDKKDETKFPN